MSEAGPFPNVCVIGSGARGIAACRTLSERGIRFDCFERLDTVAESLFDDARAALDFDRLGGYGGANDLRVCAIAEALEAYVSRFGLRSRITFGSAVEYTRRLRDGRWRVHFEQAPPSHYDAIFVATGCHRRRIAHEGTELLLPASLPFLDPEERGVLCDDVPLWNHLLHPRFPNLFLLSRMSTARLTVSIAQEQSKFAASCISGDYELPTRLQMERDCQVLQQGSRKPSPNQSQCPRSALDTRYVFHIRSERVRGTHLHPPVVGSTQAVSG